MQGGVSLTVLHINLQPFPLAEQGDSVLHVPSLSEAMEWSLPDHIPSIDSRVVGPVEQLLKFLQSISEQSYSGWYTLAVCHAHMFGWRTMKRCGLASGRGRTVLGL